MVREHICNHNLKRDSAKGEDDYLVWKHPNKSVKKDFKIRTYEDVIAYHQACLVTLQQLNDRNKETEQAKRTRLQENAKNLEEIKARLARQDYQNLVGGISGFSNQAQQKKREEMADFRFMMAFGFGFISLMFLGFLSGYCLGKYILGWGDNESLLLALGTGIPTLFVEGLLMIIRLNKWEKKRESERKQQAKPAPIIVPTTKTKHE